MHTWHLLGERLFLTSRITSMSTPQEISWYDVRALEGSQKCEGLPFSGPSLFVSESLSLDSQPLHHWVERCQAQHSTASMGLSVCESEPDQLQPVQLLHLDKWSEHRLGCKCSFISSFKAYTQPRTAGSGGILPQLRCNYRHFYFDSGMFYIFSAVSNFSNSFAEKPASLQKDPPKW